jgi:nucleotidyltransferase/DNA polymerase involved in DNA repair
MIACLWIADFVIELERQKQSELASVPMIVVTTKGKRQVVFAMSSEARRAGVMLGMAISRAIALCPDAVIQQGTPKRYQATAELVCDALLSITDRIEYEQSAGLTVWLDIGKLNFTAVNTLIECAKDIVAKELGMGLAIGIAPGRSIARIAAVITQPGHQRSIEVGEEAKFLGPLTLRSFTLPQKLLEQFEALGLEHIADLARLPYNSVRTRFGEVGSQLHRLANGHDLLRINPYQQRQRIRYAYFFDTPVNEWNMVEGVLNTFAEKGAKHLHEQTLTCSEVVLTATCDNKKRIETAHVLREPITNGKLLREEFERLFHQLNLDSGIIELSVALDSLAAPKPVQMDFFGQLFNQQEHAVAELVEHLIPRHDEAVFSRIVIAAEASYILERNVIFEPMVAA